MNRTLYSLIVVMQVITISHAQIDLLKDIKPGVTVPGIDGGVAYHGFIYYAAGELWRTNGTLNGTSQVKDIFPGRATSYPQNFFVYNDIIYFSASDANGRELWRSDGTAAGTAIVADINAGNGDSNPTNFVESNGKLFFRATTPSYGKELWVTDGTAAGTSLVRDINPGPGDNLSRFATGNPAISFHGELYFSAADGTPGAELWKTDGTSSGTSLVADVYNTIADSYVTFLLELNSKIFFGAMDGESHRLWSSDGSSAGTQPFGKMVVGAPGGLYPMPKQIMDGYLYFDGVNGPSENWELWKTDGTIANTQLIADINGDPAVGSIPMDITFVGRTLYFAARSTSVVDSKLDLYKSNGQPGNFTLISDQFQNGYAPSNLRDFNGELTFASNSKFYWYDGTTVTGQEAGLSGSPEANTFIELNDVLYFSGAGLNKFDGSTLTKVGASSPQSSNPSGFTDAGGGIMYFAADDGVHGKELWRSNGSTGETTMVKDINPAGDSNPTEFKMYNGKVYFATFDGSNDTGLWKSDGTEAGTVRVLYPYHTGSDLNGMLVHRDALYVAAAGGLWKIAGDAAPVLIFDSFVTGRTLISAGDYFYFMALDNVTAKCTLYKSDGSASGTVTISSNLAGCTGVSSDFSDLIEFQSKIYFLGLNTSFQSELWAYDGTTSAPVLAHADGGPTQTGNFTIVGNTLFFGGSDAAHGYELWKTDGTAANTVLVKDIKTGPGSSLFTAPSHGPPYAPRFNHTVFDGRLYLAADDGTHGSELWTSDGTDAGTTLVNDLAPGSQSGRPSNFVVVDSALYFLGFNGDGDEFDIYPGNIYVTNGLTCGTRKITSPTYTTNEAQNLKRIGSKLLISIKDTRIGQEPFIIEPSQVPPPPNGCGPEALTPPTALTFSNVKNDGMTVSFIPSTKPGAGYLILMRAGESPYPANVPLEGMTYHKGDAIGASVVVGAGPETTVVLNQLNPETTYYFDVFAFDANHHYLASQPLAGNQKTNKINDPQIESISFPSVAPTTITVAIVPGDPSPGGYLTLMNTSPSSGDLPEDEVTYAAGDKIGTSVVVGSGANTNVNVTSLNPDTQYFFTVIPYIQQDSNNHYVIVSAQTGNQRTLKGPEVLNITFPNVTENTITVAFTPGGPDPTGYITLMKTSAASNDVPNDGSLYQIGSSVGSSVVVGFGIDTTFNVTALRPGTEYFFSVYPYLQSGGRYDYLTSNPIEGKQQTTEVTTGIAATKEDRVAYPNPFTDALTIPFYASVDDTKVHVIIYDQVGRVIAEVVNATFETGNHEVSWDRTDKQGNKVQAGMYLYQVRAKGSVVQGLVVAK